MPVTKDEATGKWEVSVRYTDWTGARKRKHKRGFATRREAKEWERSFLDRNDGNLEMTFGDFYKVYEEEHRPRIKDSTWDVKDSRMRTKVLPYFSEKPMCDIKPTDIVRWQNDMMAMRQTNGKPYSQTYLRTLHNDVNAVFNYAVRMYDLKSNPVSKVGGMGKSEADEMKFWDPEQYAAFARKAMQEPLAFYAFETLYWCGIREGECLALWHEDPEFDIMNIPIFKTFARKKGRDVITDPKTPQSFRDVSMPERYSYELMQYQAACYGSLPTERVFPTTKSWLNNRIKKYAEEAGLEPIRVHDLRHSHVSLLIELGFNAVDIGKRIGHKSIDITLRYAHMFPNKQSEMASRLDGVMETASKRHVLSDAAPKEQLTLARAPWPTKQLTEASAGAIADKIDGIMGMV